MSLFERITYLLSAIVLFLAVGLGIAYWWSGRVPSRPASVRSDAVFLWAPAVGVPAPRRGWWFSCWEESAQDICELNNLDGSLQYKEEFLSYSHRGPVAQSALQIDTSKTGSKKLWIGQALVPLAYLQNGEILVPASNYDEGVRLVRNSENTR
jgi:hypothetical protein